MSLKTTYFLALFIAVLAFGCEPGEKLNDFNENTDDTAKTTRSLGSTNVSGPHWDKEKKLFMEEMHHHMRIAVMSKAYETCVDQEMRSLYDGFECDIDPHLNLSISAKIKKVIDISRTDTDVTVKNSPSSLDFIAAAQLGNYGTNDENFRWGAWFNDVYYGQVYKNNRECVKGEKPEIDHCYLHMEDYPFPYNEGAATTLHELMHRHGYSDDSCGNNSDPSWDKQKRTVSYIVGGCIEKVVNEMGEDQYELGDVGSPFGPNADGQADLIHFRDDGVYVSLSTGSGFTTPTKWISNFSKNENWHKLQHTRTVGDVNGDGKADIVGFGVNGVYVALSTGNSFSWEGRWTNNYYYDYGWRNYKHVRKVADVNGDSCSDIVAFGEDYVFVSLSNCNSGFEKASRWHTDFGYNDGWRVEKHVRDIGDFNGDGKADIIGFKDDGVYVALSNGNEFGSKIKWIDDFAYNVGGWRVHSHERIIGNINGGSGWDDIIGFGKYKVYLAKSRGNSSKGFESKATAYNGLAIENGGWRKEHFRGAADVNGDGKDDIVAISKYGVFVALSNGTTFDSTKTWM